MVLILVVVDDGLVLHKSNTARHQVERVLILIVVDDGLVHDFYATAGQYIIVLILIVVDDGLVHFTKKVNDFGLLS